MEAWQSLGGRNSCIWIVTLDAQVAAGQNRDVTTPRSHYPDYEPDGMVVPYVIVKAIYIFYSCGKGTKVLINYI